jgi:ABC-type Fe3+-citrate transport system substrate-binding protein
MNPKKEMTASAEKQKKFKKVQADMKKMQPKMQKKVESAIEKSGLTMKRYQTIGAAVQKDKELQQKIQNKMMKSSGAMQKGGGGM